MKDKKKVIERLRERITPELRTKIEEKLMTSKEDKSCENYRHSDKHFDEEPCVNCKRNDYRMYVDKWQPKIERS